MLDLLDYWSDSPPLHLMVKAYLGIGKHEGQPIESVEQLLSMMQQAGGSVVKGPMP